MDKLTPDVLAMGVFLLLFYAGQIAATPLPANPTIKDRLFHLAMVGFLVVPGIVGLQALAGGLNGHP